MIQIHTTQIIETKKMEIDFKKEFESLIKTLINLKNNQLKESLNKFNVRIFSV